MFDLFLIVYFTISYIISIIIIAKLSLDDFNCSHKAMSISILVMIVLLLLWPFTSSFITLAYCGVTDRLFLRKRVNSIIKDNIFLIHEAVQRGDKSCSIEDLTAYLNSNSLSGLSYTFNVKTSLRSEIKIEVNISQNPYKINSVIKLLNHAPKKG